MQWLRILITACLAGVLVGGAVFLGWDLMAKLRQVLSESRRLQKMKIEEAALSKEKPPKKEKQG